MATMSQDNSNIVNKKHNLSLHDEIQPDFSGVPSQALDAVRMRLAQLTHSLRKIRDELSKAELPQWYSLQSQLNVTLSQLVSVTSTLQHFHGTLDSTVVYPLAKFPTTSHETLLTTLLRKKYTPEVDEWIKTSKDASGLDLNNITEEKIIKILQEDKDVTKWALDIFSDEYEKYNFKGFKTKKEEELSGADIDETENAYAPSFNNYKPSKPFIIEDILSYTYRGELEDKKNEEVQTTV